MISSYTRSVVKRYDVSSYTQTVIVEGGNQTYVLQFRNVAFVPKSYNISWSIVEREQVSQSLQVYRP